jgi:hypothetical protein
MFAGHIGAALAIGRAEPRVNVGAFIAAALLLDIVLWLFVLVGWETVTIPADFATTHQPEFVFPYSHGLLASLAWSAAAGALGFALGARLQAARWRAAALLAAAVFSHWLLDALVHRPELPLSRVGSPMFGLGLWHDMTLGLAIEAIVVVVGLYLFVAAGALKRSRLIALTVLVLLLLAFTVVGMTIAPPPPSAQAMAGSSLGTLAIACAIFTWLGRHPRQGQASRGHG